MNPRRPSRLLEADLHAVPHVYAAALTMAPTMALTVLVILAWLAPASAPAQAAPAELVAPPRTPRPTSAPQPAIGLDAVRIGMKGYGLSVFAGDRIEPFEVEVVSVMRDFTPGKGVIWIRCPDARLQKTGPVMGMSGSPIYLWPLGHEGQPGQGGLLAGAFAFGFPLTKDCYAGVQPIEAMRGMLDRDSDVQVAVGGTGRPHRPFETLTTVRRLLASQAVAGQLDWRSAMLCDLLVPHVDPAPASVDDADVASPIPHAGTTPRPLLLPMMLRSAALAEDLAPLWRELGLSTHAGGMNALVGRPPAEIDPRTVALQPGSVLSIPLAFGDMELAAVGTVTEVLPDGRVLGLGHALLGEGASALPMASGFVHYVVPSLTTSFKLGGSCVLRGALQRDEAVGVLGRPDRPFATTPVRVRVNMPALPARDYQYQVVHDRRLTAVLSAVLVAESLTADAGLPRESTVRVRADVRFPDGRAVRIDSVLPAAPQVVVATHVLVPILALSQNPYQSLLPEAVDVELTVEDVLQQEMLTAAQLERAQVRPGESLVVNLRMQPYARPAYARRVEFVLPADLPEGEYQLTIADAAAFQTLLFQQRPHLRSHGDLDELLAMIQQLLERRDDALYLLLQSSEQGLALGRTELAQLPSSHRAMLAVPTNTLATSFVASWQQVVPMSAVPSGSHSFQISVRKDIPQTPRIQAAEPRGPEQP